MEKHNICLNCPRHCQVDREKDFGFCKETNKIRIAKVIDNFKWEEPCITDDKGVCAIFFSGCNLKCSYCQNYEISCGQKGKEYIEDEFISLLKEKEKINSYFDLVTPTHFSSTLLKVFQKYTPSIPIIWNSSGYESVEILKKLDKYISIYLLDFKYSNNDLGKKYSNVFDYFTIAQKVLEFCAQKADKFEGEYMKSGLIIRHLVLPGEIENSLGVIDFLTQNYKDKIVSIMSQFTPTPQSPIKRKLKPLEYKIIMKKVEEANLKGYFQDFESASQNFIPDFD